MRYYTHVYPNRYLEQYSKYLFGHTCQWNKLILKVIKTYSLKRTRIVVGSHFIFTISLFIFITHLKILITAYCVLYIVISFIKKFVIIIIKDEDISLIAPLKHHKYLINMVMSAWWVSLPLSGLKEYSEPFPLPAATYVKGSASGMVWVAPFLRLICSLISRMVSFTNSRHQTLKLVPTMCIRPKRAIAL